MTSCFYNYIVSRITNIVLLSGTYYRDFNIEVLLEKTVSVCCKNCVLAPGESRFPCPAAPIGRIVKASHPGGIGFCEMEVYGTLGTYLNNTT